MGMRESATVVVAAPPEAVFDVVTDVARLPEWNRAITEVIEVPERLETGSQWRVRMHALGQSWVSKSQLETLDRTSGRFAYRSQSDDGNPSYADWAWRVEPHRTGAKITVTVDLNPMTFWRKHLLVRIRRPALRKEMSESLAAVGAAAQP